MLSDIEEEERSIIYQRTLLAPLEQEVESEKQLLAHLVEQEMGVSQRLAMIRRKPVSLRPELISRLDALEKEINQVRETYKQQPIKEMDEIATVKIPHIRRALGNEMNQATQRSIQRELTVISHMVRSVPKVSSPDKTIIIRLTIPFEYDVEQYPTSEAEKEVIHVQQELQQRIDELRRRVHPKYVRWLQITEQIRRRERNVKVARLLVHRLRRVRPLEYDTVEVTEVIDPEEFEEEVEEVEDERLYRDITQLVVEEGDRGAG
jgi:hypothetical protein